MMSIKGLAVVLAVAVTGGLAVQSSLMAIRLGSLSQALSNNLSATQQLVQVEHQMVAKNGSLPDMLNTTKSLSGTLSALNHEAGSVSGEVGTLQQLNQGTNHTEASIIEESGATGHFAASVNQSVTALIPITENLLVSLTHLNQVSQQEVSVVQTLVDNAQLIEEKTP